VIAEGRLFCSVDAGEEYLEHAVDVLGEDIWLFSTDYPHPGTTWPNGVPLVTETGLSESAKIKILGENAKRFLPRLAAVRTPSPSGRGVG
jgi:predicted TIM-barrel fold metal-dependent hydrolase